ncbi:MAG TPA: cytochrome c [Candidatus Sulfotelmatobacter sp.]|nr:cytochrome c [Candidatus Sulfotelmatobacter sp.]
MLRLLHKLKSGKDHVGTAALGRPVERSSTAVSFAGCPILARSVRKGGIPQMPALWDFSSHFEPARLLAIAALLMTVALGAACRIDMHVQPRQNPLSHSDFFPDQRSARPPVEGTVARGQLQEDSYFYTGKIGSNPGDVMPFPVTKEVLERGRERFNIFCAPCHSRLGDGNGFVPSRGFARKPPSYHIARLQKAPVGYFFDVITNGFGIMPDYASQIPPRDRWNIVAYVRALQLSQNATLADVPAEQKIPSQPPKFREPGSGATLPVLAPEKKSDEPKEDQK